MSQKRKQVFIGLLYKPITRNQCIILHSNIEHWPKKAHLTHPCCLERRVNFHCEYKKNTHTKTFIWNMNWLGRIQFFKKIISKDNTLMFIFKFFIFISCHSWPKLWVLNFFLISWKFHGYEKWWERSDNNYLMTLGVEIQKVKAF